MWINLNNNYLTELDLGNNKKISNFYAQNNYIK